MPTRTLCKVSYLAEQSDEPLRFAAYDLWLQSFRECEIGLCDRLFPGHLYTVSRPRGEMNPSGQQLVTAVTFSTPSVLKGKTGYNRLENKVCRIYRHQNNKGHSIRVEFVDKTNEAWDSFLRTMNRELLVYTLSAKPCAVARPNQNVPTKRFVKQISRVRVPQRKTAKRRGSTARKSR